MFPQKKKMKVKCIIIIRNRMTLIKFQVPSLYYFHAKFFALSIELLCYAILLELENGKSLNNRRK